ncbi:hypothetical protein ambt_01765 [Alteromonas naphthalenivorans]|jgi:hypothetical protein|uniref:Transposase n=1 Tax=Alteromonas naphthalenivorans TaxID=715451 RepID=F5ZAD7_ALTNA|nr:hypothetical protein ambt_01765 [Alteromonas naphthalenivorans]
MKVCNARENLVSHKGKQSDMTFVMNKLWGWIKMVDEWLRALSGRIVKKSF